MKILIVLTNYYPGWGGAENQARKQARELVRRGHEVRVLTWRKNPAWEPQETVDGVTVLRVDRRTGGALAELLSLVAMSRALARAVRWADVVAAHQMLRVAYLAGWAGLLTLTPVVVKPAITARAVDSDLRPLDGTGLRRRLRRLWSLPLRRYATAVAMTEEIAGDLRRLGFRRVVRIPNGVEDKGIPDRARLRARLFAPLGLGPDAQVVAAAGRLVDWKGFDVLLAAWARLQGERSRRCLVIVGSGPEEHALRTIAGKLGVNDSVHFVPNSYDAADYLAAADLVVVPSDYEGMSNVLLEAMVAAVPVVATRVSGAVDLIIDRVNGCLVPPRDPEALAAAIDEMLRSPGRLGRRSRETVLAQCELRHVVDLYEQAFQHAARLRLSRRTFIGPSRYSAGAAQESTVCAESAE